MARKFFFLSLLAVLALLLVVLNGHTGYAQGVGLHTAVVRGTTWHVSTLTAIGPIEVNFPYGKPGDTPLMCDWDGDGLKTPAVVRGNIWHLRNTNSGGAADVTFTYGRSGDIPICGDWNKSGTDTPGVVRGNIWHLSNSPFGVPASPGGPADITFSYGRPGDIPIVGDWGGNCNLADKPGVVRGNTWYLRDSVSAGQAYLTFTYGRSGDIPIVGDWDGSIVCGDADTPGVVRGNTWHLRNSNSAGVADVTFTYGRSGDIPLVWDCIVPSGALACGP